MTMGEFFVLYAASWKWVLGLESATVPKAGTWTTNMHAVVHLR